MGSGGLKPGWTRVAFGEMATCVNERIDDPTSAGVSRYVGLEHLDSDSLTIRRWGSPTDVTATKLRFRTGDIIFGRRRVYQRKLAVADFDGICSAHAMVLRAKSPAVVPEFLPFFMQSDLFMDRAKTISVGSLSPTINWKTLEKEEFALPPLTEQRRMASVLRAVDRNADALRRVVEVLRILETSIFHQFISEIDLASHYHLEDFALKVEYGSSAKPTKPTPANIGVPILRIPNILQNNLNLAILKRVSLPPAETKRFRLSTGDILMVRTNGNPSYVGRCISIPTLPEPMVFASYLLRIVVDATRIRPEFAARTLNMFQTRKQVSQHIRSSAGNYNINAPSVRSIRVPCPPLTSQEAILSQVKTLTSRATSVTSRLTTLEAIRKSFTSASATSIESDLAAE